MRLEIKNICSIANAKIEFNGITIIAGENGTGKSTIGKAFWAMFKSLYQLNDRVIQNQILAIRTALRRININIGNFTSEEIKNLCEEIYDLKNEKPYIQNKELIISNIEKIIKNKTKDKVDNFGSLYQDVLLRIYIVITENIEDKKQEIIKKYFEAEFNKKVVNYNSTEGKIELSFNNKHKDIIYFNEKGISGFDIEEIIHNSIYYFDGIDTDNNLSVNEINIGERFTHKMDLNRNISFPYKSDNDFDYEINDVIDNIFSEFGDLGKVYIDENDEFKFTFSDDSKAISTKMMAQGLKNITVLKQLLKTSLNHRKDLLILDEPEMNLHPKWQAILAKVICILQKKYDFTILICSHSPFFITAIKYYINSKIFNLKEKTKYYLAEKNINEVNVIKDVSDKPDDIFYNLYKDVLEIRNGEKE